MSAAGVGVSLWRSSLSHFHTDNGSSGSVILLAERAFAELLLAAAVAERAFAVRWRLGMNDDARKRMSVCN